MKFLEDFTQHNNNSSYYLDCVWDSYGALAAAVDGGAAVAASDPHQAVQRAAFAVQAGAVSLDLRPAVQHDLRTQREILHQHPPVVQHLPLTLAADWTTCTEQHLIITDTIKP